jgi:hypothetical protein
MLDFAYYGLSAYAILFLVLTFYKAGKPSGSSNKLALRVGGLIAAWLLYVYLLIQSGFLLNFSLPPRFPLLILLPLVIFSIVLYHKLKKSKIIHNISAKSLVYFQTFRILVEIMLLYTFIEGVIPISATFEGANFDIIMGISAPIVALTIYRNLKKNRGFAVAWHILGIAMILFVAVIIGTSMYFPLMWTSRVPLVSPELLSFPYFLIAACIAPFAILIHVIALAQLRALKK